MNHAIRPSYRQQFLCALFMVVAAVQDSRCQCDQDPMPTQFCADAPSVCRTGQCYTTQQWSPSGEPAEWCGPNTAVHNPQYFTFVASSPTVRIDIMVDDCMIGGCGLQAAIIGECPWLIEDVIACDPGTPEGGTMILESTGLQPGQQYWLMIDGCAGDVCTYTLVLTEGIALASSETIDTVVCGNLLYDGLEYGPGSYELTYESSLGCDSVVILNVHAALEVDLGGLEVCFPIEDSILADPIVTGINGGITYLWNDGSTDSVFLITNPIEGDTISVTVTDSEGCSASAYGVIESALTIQFFPDTVTICEGNPIGMEIGPLIFGGSFPYMFVWITPAGDTVHSNFIVLSDFGLYRLIVTDSEGCADEATLFVEERPLPQFDLGTYDPFCPDSLAQGIELDVVIDPDIVHFSFMGWSGPPFIVDHPGSYSVTVTDVYGCRTADTVVIEVLSLPSAHFEVEICDREAKFFSESLNTSYMWDFGDGSFDTLPNPIHVYSQDGSYVVELTVEDTCGTVSHSQQIEINSSAPINIACESAIGLGSLSSKDVACSLVEETLFTCITGTNKNAPANDRTSECSGFHDPSVWYSFITDSEADLLNITIYHEYPSASIQLYESQDGSCDNLLVAGITEDSKLCVQSSDGKLLAANVSVKPLTHYFLLISAINSTGGTFELCLNTVKTNEEPCVVERNLQIVSRSFGGPPEGPFFPGEQVRVCMNLENFLVSVGPQNCQWFQGLVPVFGAGWDPSSFDSEGQPLNASMNGDTLPSPNVTNGGMIDWWTNVRYHHQHCYYRSGNMDDDASLEMCHGLLDASCDSTGFVSGCCGPCWESTSPDDPGMGTPLPAGWFSSGVDGSCGGLIGWPAVDWGDGNTCSGATGPWEFCFDLIVSASPQEGKKDLSLGFFTFSDGELGAWTGGESVCGDDLPVIVKLPACWDEIEYQQDTLAEVCSRTPLIIDPRMENAEVWNWTVNAPSSVTGFSEGYSVCNDGVSDTLINTGGELAFVTYTFTGFAGPCPVTVKEIIIPVKSAGFEVGLSPSLGFCHALDSLVLNAVVEGVHEDLEYLWWNGSQDSFVTIYNPIYGDTVSVTVTDAATGCTSAYESFVGNSGLSAEISPAIYVNCPGDTTGPVFNLDITGGTPPYSIGWMSPLDTVPGPKPPFDVFGTYYLIVTDSLYCEDTVSFEILPEEDPVADFSYELAGQTLLLTNLSQNGTSYAWSFGDGFTSSDAEPVHVYQDGGDFMLQLIVFGYCSNDTLIQVIHVSGVHTSDIEWKESVIIFPNPNRGTFSILSEQNEITGVQIFNMLGQELGYHKTGEMNYTIANAISGMYLVFITAQDKTVVRIMHLY